MAAAAEVIDALRADGTRLTRLLAEAESLDQRALLLAQREHQLFRNQALARAERGDLDARAEEVAERESAVAHEDERLRLVSDDLMLSKERVDLELARLREEAERLAEREARYLSRWRWLVRSWHRRPLQRRDSMRVCDLLFVPTPQGYRLLEQTGIALAPGATLQGLINEQLSFVVSKIAPWPFEGRWCAYLQEQPTRQGEDGL